MPSSPILRASTSTALPTDTYSSGIRKVVYLSPSTSLCQGVYQAGEFQAAWNSTPFSLASCASVGSAPASLRPTKMAVVFWVSSWLNWLDCTAASFLPSSTTLL